MNTTSDLFESFLTCPTKCFLRSRGEVGSGNEYADWVKNQNSTYRNHALMRLQDGLPQGECLIDPPSAKELKSNSWLLAVNVLADMENLATQIHAVERVPSASPGKPAHFIPIRFVCFNKPTKDDRLLLSFDAFVLSKATGRDVNLGKIIHGDDYSTLKVKITSLLGTVGTLTGTMSVLLANGSPPDLILNRHCGECEFQAQCKQKAIEKDDLGLLSNVKEKERKKFNSEGIFTVTQLSHTFRPRRRPKRLRDKREKYHHALKALAIREKKIHIVGTPELKIDGTPVFLDVEGLPDRVFYYLIGLRVKTADAVVHHSFWADGLADEKRAWSDFLAVLATIEKPVLLHYGSYETIFLRRMCERYGEPPEGSPAAQFIASAINVLSVIYAQIYFPTYSNGLKDVANYLGFRWSDSNPSGLSAMLWRYSWEITRSSCFKAKLEKYNAEDCQALETVTSSIVRIGTTHSEQKQENCADLPVIHTELLPQKSMWPKFSSPLPEFEQMNKAARWDYQRNRIYVRSSKRIRKIANRVPAVGSRIYNINKRVVLCDQPICPKCSGKGYRHLHVTTKLLQDLFFGRYSLKRWVVEYRVHLYWCGTCRVRFGMPRAFWPGTKYGRNLVAYIAYQMIELYTPQETIRRTLKRLFGYDYDSRQINRIKVHAAVYYEDTQRNIIERIVKGSLVHVDETRANIKGKTACVWVFTNLHEVAYLYSDSRESEIAKITLADFRGVLVSDFYSGYDSFACPQQKCLLHLIRDLNADILRHPYDEDMKRIINGFAKLLKEAVETIDHFGLKKHFLQKHKKSVERFYRQLEDADVQSEPAVKIKQRFEKNRDNLFTFLDYDGVPWNNNNAEHAIKAFAALRDVIEGSSTQKGTEYYLILLSVCQTCKYSGVDFLDFLRSGEKDIDTYAQKHARARRSAPNQPF